MKHITAGLVAIAVVAVAISIGITVCASVYSPTSEPEVSSHSISNEKCGFQNTPEEYVLNTTLPSVPDKLMVYSVVTNVSEADATSLAERLGMNGSIRETPNRFVVRDGQHHFEVIKFSGRVSYRNKSKNSGWRVETENDRPEGAPSDEEAIEIATKFLNDTGLMPEDAVLHGVVPQMMYTIPAQDDKPVIVSWVWLTVSFRREINGYPVTGCGAKMSVALDGNGNVIDLYKLWREYEPYNEYPIITPEEAFEKFEAEGIDVCLWNVSTATINNVYPAYYSKCAIDEQTYLQPVYVFKGEAEGDGETEEFRQYIVAAPELGGIEFPRLMC